jgi:ribose 5-phosphate isomerase RpiB
VNLLCIGAQIVGIKLAEEILGTVLVAEFSSEPQFRRRVAKLAELERQAARELSAGQS